MKKNNRLLQTLVIVVPMVLIIIAPKIGHNANQNNTDQSQENLTK